MNSYEGRWVQRRKDRKERESGVLKKREENGRVEAVRKNEAEEIRRGHEMSHAASARSI